MRAATTRSGRRHDESGMTLVSILLAMLIIGVLAGGVYAGLSGKAGAALGGWFGTQERLPADLVDAAGGDSAALTPIGGGPAADTAASPARGTAVVTCRANLEAVESAVQQRKVVLGRLPTVDELRQSFADPIPFGPVPDASAGYAIFYAPGADGSAYELIGTWKNGESVGRC